jgi:hypothetical protein
MLPIFGVLSQRFGRLIAAVFAVRQGRLSSDSGNTPGSGSAPMGPVCDTVQDRAGRNRGPSHG